MMKTRRPNRISSLVLALVLALSLCVPARAEGEPVAFGVSLDPSPLALTLGGTSTLRAQVTLPDGLLPVDVTLNWVIADPTVATLTPDPASGTAQVAAVGAAGSRTSVTVTATAAGKGADGGDLTASASCDVVIQYSPATEVVLTRQSLLLDVGKTQELSASVSPSSADQTNVTWTSSVDAVARLSRTEGSATVVTAGVPGESTVTATAGAVSAKCFVTVPGITLSSDALTLVAGGTATLSKNIYGGIGSMVEWVSSKETVAQVVNGLLTARGAGTTVITATVKGTEYKAQCTVTVKENTAGLITASASAGLPLPFSSLSGELRSQCSTVLSSPLSYVTGLTVSTADGILHYGYASAEDPGAGVGTSERYYYTGGGIGAMSLDNVSFVPSADFNGTTTDIGYTGYATNGQFFKGIIRVSVERSTAINYSTSGSSPARFQAADFNTICRSRNGRDLEYITFSLPLSSKGVLYYNYTGNSLDTKVTDQTRYYRSGKPGLDEVCFVPAENFTGSITLQYSARDTMGYAYVGRVVITVTNPGGGKGDISYSTPRDQYVTFRTADFYSVCQDMTGERLSYVRFDLPATSVGTLYYNYTTSGSYDSRVSDSRNYYYGSTPFIGYVSFVPAPGFSGEATVDFTGWTTEGDRFTGVVSITVGSDGSDGSVYYSTGKNSLVTFLVEDFDAICRTSTGYALSSVRLELPSSSRGTLYYQYRGSGSYGGLVSASQNYYANSNSPYLSDVSFMPYSNYSGNVDIDFTGWDVKGNRFTGTVYIRVGASGGAFSYSTPRNKPVTLTSNDFNEASLAQTGSSVKYVRFNLPSVSQGTLYYKYENSTGQYDSKVTSSVSYYRSALPSLSSVSFLPAQDYSGKASFGFTAWDVNGSSFSGTVEITVGSGSYSGSTVSYSVISGKTVTFNDGDFNTISRDQNGAALSYVRFELPSSTQGILHYNYTSSTNTGSKVAASSAYYRSTSPLLSSVTFVPTAGYLGTVDIPFNGWDVSGVKFTGTVTITVKASPPAGDITYATGTAPVTFNASDFQSVCNGRDSGSLSSVVFSLPDERAGKLWYEYRGPSSKGTAVSSLLAYTPSGSQLLSKISFVPREGFSGSAAITYTGRDSAGASYTGTVRVIVTPPSVSTHYSDMGKHVWAVPSVEYLYANNILTGLADQNYRPAADITRGDFMLMLCRALNFSASGGTGFRDISSQYYAQAVLTAQALGIAQGDGTYFYPERSLTRQDAAAFLHRALRVATWSVPDGNSVYLNGFSDQSSVADYAAAPMSSMVELGVLKGDEAGRLVPVKALTRAEMAVILHRVMTM